MLFRSVLLEEPGKLRMDGKEYTWNTWGEILKPDVYKRQVLPMCLAHILCHIRLLTYIQFLLVLMPRHQNEMCIRDRYDITRYVRPGKCTITIRVDNRIKEINVGPDSHSITDQTQANWIGIVGRICLQATPKTYFDDIQIYPEPEQKLARVKVVIKGTGTAKVKMCIRDRGMPVFAKLGKLTGEQKYFDKMWDMYEYTRNKHGENGL